MKRYLFIKIKLAIYPLILIVCLSACAPTPEYPLIVNKGDDHLSQQLLESNSEKIYNIESDIWKENFDIGKDRVNIPMKVRIDAKILIPSIKKFPVALIQLKDFNKSDLKRVAEGFLEGSIRITDNGYLSKEELSDIIISIKKDIADLEQEPKSEETNSTIEQ